jgi:hypothetical protein
LCPCPVDSECASRFTGGRVAVRDFLEGTECESGTGRCGADVRYPVSLVRMKSGFIAKLL